MTSFVKNQNAIMNGNVIANSTEKTTPVDADLVGISDSADSGILKKLTWANIKATLIATAMTWGGKQTFDGGVAIKGATSAVAAAYVGEVLRQSNVTNTIAISSGVETTVFSQVLTAGVWCIVGHATGGCNGNNSLTTTILRLKIDGTLVDVSESSESVNTMDGPRQAPSALHWAGTISGSQTVLLTAQVVSPGACISGTLLQCVRIA